MLDIPWPLNTIPSIVFSSCEAFDKKKKSHKQIFYKLYFPIDVARDGYSASVRMVYGRYGVACRRYMVSKRVGMGWPKKSNTHKEFMVPPGSLLVAFSVSLVEFCALRRAGPPYEQTYKRVKERLPYVFRSVLRIS